MILRLSALFLVLSCLNLVESQPAAQGGASLSDLLGQANGNGGKSQKPAMILQLSDFLVLSGLKLVEPAAQGGANLTNGETSMLDQNILEVFGKPPGTNSTIAAPAINNIDVIPGTGSCTCVPYYLCNNGSINTNREDIIDIRLNDGPCESYLEVCCNKDDQADQPITPTSPPTRESRVGCGYRNPEGVGFRISGDNENEAQFAEFPWMVAVLREETVEGNPAKPNLVYQCGGALIHPQMIVTIAHCVSGKNKGFTIRAGEWDTQHTQEVHPHQDREVQNVIVHPQYYAGAFYNDVAVLYTKEPFNLAENVATICLPPQGTILDEAQCYATGWGKDVFGQKGKYQVILKKIDLPIVPNNQCQEKLRTTRLGKFFQLHSSFMCAGGVPGKDTCKGDGGSPLVCPVAGQSDRYFQMGIVAWGIGCGENNTPGVYVNLPKFRDWIDTQMRTYNLDTSYYKY